MSDFEISDDEEMARAIAASLQTHGQEKNRTDTYIPSDDIDFQEELQRAIEASKRSASHGSSSPKKVKVEKNVEPIKTTVQEPSMPRRSSNAAKSSNPASDFIRQRAQLEQERLARSKGVVNTSFANSHSTSAHAKKRSRSRSMENSTEEEDDEDEDEDVTPQAKRREQIKVDKGKGKEKEDTTEFYWSGELRQTANILTEKGDIQHKRKLFRVSEIIGEKKDVTFAILSSYSTDIEWLYHFFLPDTPVILINQPRESGEAEVKAILPNWVMTMPPMRGGRGAMHVKLMLIFYKTGRLRLAIPTANFIAYDWREIENSAWVQDFPLSKSKLIGKDPKAASFSSALQMVFQRLNVPDALNVILKEHPNLPLQHVGSLGKLWDFSSATVKLIPSMAGKHEGWDQVIRQGHVALMKAIMEIGAHAGHDKRKGKMPKLVLECQGSSIGTYSAQWLQEIYSSSSGISPETWLNQTKAQRAKLPVPPIKILFPSAKTVAESLLGENGAGTMFCREAQWNASTFPRQLFHDSNSKRGGVLMHTKMILGLWNSSSREATITTNAIASSGKGSKEAPISLDDSDENMEEDEEEDEVEIVEPYSAGWLYVGSHNFTPSAWGNVSGTPFTPIINILNYELGVLIPLPEDREAAERKANELVSWVRPPRRYNVAGGDKPWCQS